MKLKIAVVCFTGNSGLTDYSVSLCRELAKTCDITFITADSYDAKKYRVDFPAVKLFRRTRNYPIDIFKFTSYLLQHKPDVVLFESWIKYPLFELVLIKLFKTVGIRTALTIHDLLPHYPKPWSKRLHSWYYNCFDRLIVHSERTADGLLGMEVTAKPLIVPHGVYDIFRLDELKKSDVISRFPEIENDDFVVLFFGHIETRKGIFEFLKASDLLSSNTKIKFLVAGRNDLGGNATFANQFDVYKQHQNVVVHDHSIPFDQVQHYFVMADVVALPYLEGTTSGIMKLAMAFDKPVIVADVGDLAETLKDWSGILLNGVNLDNEIQAAISNIYLQYDNYLKSIKTNKNKYCWTTIGEKYFEYLKRLENL